MEEQNHNETPTEEGRPRPTPKMVMNELSRILTHIRVFKPKSERDIELFVYGAILSRWREFVGWKKQFGGRVADLSVGSIPLEIKILKRISEKDRLIGQVEDYLKASIPVIIVVRDDRSLLKDSSLSANPNVLIAYC